MTKVYSHLSGEERVRIDELRNREGLGVRPCRIRHPQGHPRAREDRPHLGQRHGVLLPPARGRGPRHAHLLCEPVLLTPEGQQREPQRTHPPLPAQEDPVSTPDGRGPAGHRPGDQRHPHEGPGLGNAQRGLVPRARQDNVKDKPPKDECCTYKLNPGIRLFFTRARITSSKPPK